MSEILITGGTGNLGKILAQLLTEKQISYVIGSRSNKPGADNIVVMDLLENKGIKEAVQG